MDTGTFPSGNRLRRLASLSSALALAVAAVLLLGCWAASAEGAAPRPAAPRQPSVFFLVTTTVDLPDNNLADGECHIAPNGPCSLRAAVQQLDHDSGGSISLPAGTFNLTRDADGDLNLRKNINISGVTTTQTIIQGNPPGWPHRLLRVQDGATVLLSGLTISGGNVPSLSGGGIAVLSGTLIAIDVDLAHNQAGLGGGLFNAGSVDLYNSRLENNVAYTSGAGIYNAAISPPNTNLILVNDELTNNHLGAAGDGGGLFNAGIGLVQTTTFELNTAQAGAGLANEAGGRLDIQASTISGNQAEPGDGGGVFNTQASTVTFIWNSTVSGNSSAHNGGGLANHNGHLDLSSTTVVYNFTTGAGQGGGLYNTGGTFGLRNTLVALNSDASLNAPDCSGAFDSDGYNLVLITTSVCSLSSATGNIIGQDPLLTTFAAHGGPTRVWGLQAASPAVDAGDPAGCQDAFGRPLAIDQRGFPRHFNGHYTGTTRCDIGAFELVAPRLWLPLLRR